jgi:large subunit ribosomal protein L17
MRHRKAGKKLNRNSKQRKTLFKNLISHLVLLEEIKTTLPKAKAVAPLFDKLLTAAKSQTVKSFRQVNAYLGNPKATQKMIKELVPRFKERKGGYTRIIRLGNRLGDNAPLVKIELVEKKS